MSSNVPSTAPRRKPPIAAIRIGAADRRPGGTRYGRLLVWFMRAMALLWFGQGVAQWAAVLTADGYGAGALDTVTSLEVTAVVFFCAMDMIAAVGLWLAAPWGGAVWLVVIAAQWLAILLLPRVFPSDWWIGLAGLGLALLYVPLTYKAARAAETSA